jgi:3-hydroxyisobutyrate dehydrogenase/2-hydroxy-3-oxopropionate reductase
MARRLLAAGYPLTVHNRSRAVVEDFVRLGTAAASSPREVVEASNLVLTALPFPVSVDEVYFGPDGIGAYARPGQVVADHSTVGPDLSRRVAAALRARGAAFLDAPVSGGPEGAEQGALAIMVGGETEAFERARPVFEVLGRHVRHCGPSGAGSTMKLLNQVLIAIHSAATAEVLSLAERAGVDPALVLEMIPAGLAASAIFERNGRRIVDGDFQPGARIDLMVKDAALVRELSDALELRLPVFAQARASVEEALNLGFGHQDLAGVVRALRPELAGTAREQTASS